MEDSVSLSLSICFLQRSAYSNPKSQTISHKPQTANRKPQTANYKPVAQLGNEAFRYEGHGLKQRLQGASGLGGWGVWSLEFKA